jgi:hypothetical protein
MAKLEALIMPSAVAPSPETPFQALLDPEIRLRQTVKAICYWVKQAEKKNFKILVVDNTGYATNILQALPRKVAGASNLQIVDIPPITKADTSRGKGAGETSTLIAGLKILDLNDEAIVAKVNARYITTNGLFLIEEVEERFDFVAWPRPLLDSVDTTFFAGRSGFLREAFGYVYSETDDLRERFVENLYADYSIRNPNCNYVRFSYSPAIKGQSGTTGSHASPLNEFRMVSTLVRGRKSLRLALRFLKPRYQRGLR